MDSRFFCKEKGCPHPQTARKVSQIQFIGNGANYKVVSLMDLLTNHLFLQPIRLIKRFV